MCDLKCKVLFLTLIHNSHIHLGRITLIHIVVTEQDPSSHSPRVHYLTMQCNAMDEQCNVVRTQGLLLIGQLTFLGSDVQPECTPLCVQCTAMIRLYAVYNCVQFHLWYSVLCTKLGVVFMRIQSLCKRTLFRFFCNFCCWPNEAQFTIFVLVFTQVQATVQCACKCTSDCIYTSVSHCWTKV